jgi:hypothetical protein
LRCFFAVGKKKKKKKLKKGVCGSLVGGGLFSVENGSEKL